LFALLTALVPVGVTATVAHAITPDVSCDAAGTHCAGYFAARDGVKLAWQVYLPGPPDQGPYPTVLDYSGYEPASTFFDGLKDRFLERGYAVAGVNVRGTGCSGGKFDYFEEQEWLDGYDAVEFLATRTNWSNGDIGMVGKSYPGITPLFVAPTRPPHLRAIVPGAFFSDSYRDVAYPGGIQNVVFVAGWSLASQPANTADQVFSGISGLDQQCIQAQAEHGQNPPHNPFLTLNEHPYDDADPYHVRGPYLLAKDVQVPVLVQLAWQDEELAARGIDYVNRLPAGVPWRAVLSNGDHSAYYKATPLAEITRFLSFYLKKQVPSGDACASAGDYAAALACYQGEPRVAVLNDLDHNGNETFVHRHASWPVTESVDRWFLHEGGALTHGASGASEAATSYNYTPSVGSNSYGTKRDFQSRIPGDDIDFWQERPPAGSIATFTTPPFAQDTLYTGNGSLDLWLSSTAPDTDLEIMVTELRPDGSGGWLEQYVQKGWLRASHRKLDAAQSTALRPYQTHQALDVQPLVPTIATEMRVELFPFSQVFRAGRRLRLTIEAPSTKPELWGFAPLPAEARNSIYTDAAHPSSLALPLVPLTDGLRAQIAGHPEATCANLGSAASGFTRSLTNQPCRAVTLEDTLPATDVPELPIPVLMPLVALAVFGVVLVRRRRTSLS
jgi:predicted acyl esterase